jgi:hypothetical protein
MNPIRKKLIAILMPLLFTLLSHQTASAYYDPGVQRWINRDPLGETEETETPNLYQFVLNNPVYVEDAWGLSVWKCTRTSDLPLGRHAYLWDDRPGPRIHSCGQGGILGQGPTTHPRDNGPVIINPPLRSGPIWPPPVQLPPWQRGDYTCIEIPNTAGNEDSIMGHCRDCINSRLWAPPLYDCHNACDAVLGDLGYPSPPMPRR